MEARRHSRGKIRFKLLHKWTLASANTRVTKERSFAGADVRMCTLTLRLAAPINIRCYFCFSLYSSYTKTQWHTGTFIRWQNTMTHTHTQSTLCTLPMLVFPCLQMERGSRSSFSNLLFLSPLRFRLALWGSVDVVLGLTSSAQAIDKLCF